MEVKCAAICANLRPILFTLRPPILNAQVKNFQASPNNADSVQRLTEDMTILSSKSESSQEIETGLRGDVGPHIRLNRRDIVPAVLLVASCVFIFRGAIFDGHLLFGSDFVAFYQGMKQFLFDEIHTHHSIPFWNPYVFGGMPFWAHFESTIFYPLDILFWFMAPAEAFGYTMFIHMSLAALFMYFLLRSLNTGYGGSFVAAAVFTCNGFIMATLYDGQMFRIQAYIWLPLIIYLLNRALKSESPVYSTAIAGLFWGIQILSGSPQDALYTLMAAILFCLFANSYEGPKAEAIQKLVLTLLLFTAFGLGTASIQIIPAIEFIKLSVRSAFDTYELVTLGSYPLEGIITAIIPDFFGRYATGDFWVSNVPWSIPLYNLYVGTLPLILLFFISGRHLNNRKIIFFAAVLALCSFVLALGANTPLYRFLYFLPGFDRIRAPAKIIFLYVFALSLLAGKGMDGLLSLSGTSISKRAWIVLVPVLLLIVLDGIFHWDRSLIFSFFSPFILDETIPGKSVHAARVIGNEFHVITLLCTTIFLIILLAARGILNKKLALVLLCMLILFDLTYMNWGAIRYGDEGYQRAEKDRDSLTQSLGRDKSVFRVGSYPNPMGPNFEMYLGFQTVAGYNPLYLHRYYEYIRAYNKKLLAPGNVWFFYTPHGKRVLMDLLNVKYEISHDKGTYFLKKSFFPRAFLISRHKIVKRDEILDLMTRPDFDPSKLVLFEAEDSCSVHQDQESFPPGPTTNMAKIVSYRPDEIAVSVNSSAPGYLFLSEVYYPGWKAFVDGQSEPILRGNYMFRVVKIPRGNHLVRLVFEPLTIQLGSAVTIFTLFIVLCTVFYRFMRKRLRPFKIRSILFIFQIPP